MPSTDAEPIIVNSREFDGTIRRTWTCEMVQRLDPLLVFVGTFDREVSHAELGIIQKGTVSYEYYWLDRWYNIFRFHEPNGEFRNFYCNVNMPPTFSGGVLDYIDLDIDIVVWPDGQYRVLDHDDLAKSSAKYGYTAELLGQISQATKELIAMNERGEFPFDHDS